MSSVDPLLSSFLNQFNDQKELLKNEDVKTLSRGESLIPRLMYTSVGRFTHIGNTNAYCRFVNRSIKLLGLFFALKLGVGYQIENNLLILKSSFKQQMLRSIQKKFYKEQVQCGNCQSPQTQRVDLEYVKCSSCGQIIRRKYE